LGIARTTTIPDCGDTTTDLPSALPTSVSNALLSSVQKSASLSVITLEAGTVSEEELLLVDELELSELDVWVTCPELTRISELPVRLTFR
jgi:hypothetical protein